MLIMPCTLAHFQRASESMPEAHHVVLCRLRHFGDYKHFLGGTQPFAGASSPFTVGQQGLGSMLRRMGAHMSDLLSQTSRFLG